jgi:hypothetical protein
LNRASSPRIGYEFFIAHDGEAVRDFFGERTLVGNHDDGHTWFRLFSQEREDRLARGGIKIPGGLVGEKNCRAIHQAIVLATKAMMRAIKTYSKRGALL